MTTQERKTASMLQRIPAILAVTAASYGLQMPPQAARWGQHPQAERTQPVQPAQAAAALHPQRLRA
jgi:hypothetical protein